MIYLFISVILVSTITDIAQSKYVYQPEIRGWVKPHKVVATWDEAYLTCQNEGRAVLASPITEELLNEMISLISVNNHSTSYFIGTSANFYPGGQFVSIEGVSLDDMPVTDMVEHLDPLLGDCLSMSRGSIIVSPCKTRRPFICYKEQQENAKLNECGTTDDEYKLESSTGSCYKVHSELKRWDLAYSTCVEEGGYLVILNDEHEAQIINRKTSHWEYVTIGMRDAAGNGTWKSVHGDDLDDIYNVWEERSTPATLAYRCGRLQNTGRLSYGICDFDRQFVCEKDPKNIRFSLPSLDVRLNKTVDIN